MITTRVIPQATASATSQELLIEITENVCKPFCVNSSIQPSGSVSFTQGTISVVNGNAVVPVVATITIVSPSGAGCGCAHSQVFTETFNLAFEATTANSVTLTAGTSTLVTPTNVKCCKARGLKLTTSLTATIA